MTYNLGHGFIWRAYFRKFEEGKRNRVTIPLKIKYTRQFFHYKRDRIENWVKSEVDVRPID